MLRLDVDMVSLTLCLLRKEAATQVVQQQTVHACTALCMLHLVQHSNFNTSRVYDMINTCCSVCFADGGSNSNQDDLPGCHINQEDSYTTRDMAEVRQAHKSYEEMEKAVAVG